MQMGQTLSKALRMFIYRVLPEESQKSNIAVTQNREERKELLNNYKRTKFYSSRCLLIVSG